MSTPSSARPSSTRRKTTAFITITVALAAAALLTPTAAAYVSPPHSAPTTIMVERTAYRVPVTDAATLLIRTKDGLGTGFNVGNGRIVTAAHVVKGSDTVTIKTYDGRVGTAKVEVFDDAGDLAVLLTSMVMMEAEVDCRAAAVGDNIMSIGNPLGQEFVSAFGRIAGAPRTVGDRSMYVTDMTTVMGQSGGPVFRDGRVIGVVSAVMLAPLKNGASYVPTIIGFGYVVPSAGVCKMLAGLQVEGGDA